MKGKTVRTIYSDCVASIDLQGGMIRLNFGDLVPESDGTSSLSDTHTKIIMPIPGFIKLVESADELVEKMKELGIVREKEDTTESQ